jgi:hypothetical protein
VRTWIRALLATPTATEDFLNFLKELIAEEDKLSKASNIEQLYTQRGKVEALTTVKYHFTQAKEKK